MIDMGIPGRLVVLATLASTPIVVNAQQPPVYQAIVLDRRSPGEQRLAERIAHVDAALAIRVIGEPRGVAVPFPKEMLGGFFPNADPSPFVHTETSIEIVEVFKASPLAGVAGAPLTLVTSGGRAAWKDGHAVDRVAPSPFQVGDVYVVLASDSRDHVTIFAEAFEIFHLASGRLIAHGTAPLAHPFTKPLRDRPWLDALALLRTTAADAEAQR